MHTSKRGGETRVKEMMDGVLEQSMANFNLIAELYEKNSKEYADQVSRFLCMVTELEFI
jgi:hypothetical protein